MPTLRFIREAREDLEELWVSIAQANPTAADKYLEEIYQKTLLHSHRPYLGQAEPTLARRLGQTPQSVRSFLYRNHLCYYWLRGADMWMLGYIDTRRHRNRALRERLRRLRTQEP